VEKFPAKRIYYATLSNGLVETFIQENGYSIDNITKGDRIYVGDESRVEMLFESLRSYYKEIRAEDNVSLLRLADYMNSFFKTKDLIFSRSPLLLKRCAVELKANNRALKDQYYGNYSSWKDECYLQYYISNLLSTQKLSENEALYIAKKIENIQKQKLENANEMDTM